MEIVTFRERPDLADQRSRVSDVWPEFMLQDPVATVYYANVDDRWADLSILAVDGEQVVAVGHAVSFRMGAELGREELPDGGWDDVIMWSYTDDVFGRSPTAIAALEVSILPEARGEGLATDMLKALGAIAIEHGFDELAVPVRPSRKHMEPDVPMDDYVRRVRPDGLPEDPWLRAHARMGAEIVKVCPTAMTITGTIEEWRRWTGLPFDRPGSIVVPGALTPVHVSVEHDHAVYVEPNVWMVHPLAPEPA
jgi:GNAT superfamily N-acetyltransferase